MPRNKDSRHHVDFKWLHVSIVVKKICECRIKADSVFSYIFVYKKKQNFKAGNGIFLTVNVTFGIKGVGDYLLTLHLLTPLRPFSHRPETTKHNKSNDTRSRRMHQNTFCFSRLFSPLDVCIETKVPLAHLGVFMPQM